MCLTPQRQGVGKIERRIFMDIYESVKELIRIQFETEEDKINSETTFDELGADSLDIIDLISVVENEYEIEIPDDSVGSIKNVGEMVRLLEERI